MAPVVASSPKESRLRRFTLEGGNRTTAADWSRQHWSICGGWNVRCFIRDRIFRPAGVRLHADAPRLERQVPTTKGQQLDA